MRPTLTFRVDPAIFIAILIAILKKNKKIIKTFIHLPTLSLHDSSFGLVWFLFYGPSTHFLGHFGRGQLP